MGLLRLNRKMQKQVRSLRNNALRARNLIEYEMKRLEGDISRLQNKAFEMQGSGNLTESKTSAYEAAQKNKALQALRSRYENVVFSLSHLEIYEKELFARDVVQRTNLEIKLPKGLVKRAEKLRARQEKENQSYKTDGVDLEYLGRIIGDVPAPLYQHDAQFRDFEISLRPSSEYTQDFNQFIEVYNRGVVKVGEK